MKKARQAAEAGGGWLRADIRDGMWMFTPWARAGLGDKFEQIAQHVASALRRVPGIDGAVLSNGADVDRRVKVGRASLCFPRRPR